MAGNKRLGLGRGLSSLLPEETISEETQEIFYCPIEAIRPSSFQPRFYKKDENIQELAASIKEKGILQPILVREITPGIYEIIAGERRWRAAKLAGLERIPVIVKALSSQEILELALIENLQREDLNPIEEARGYQRLIKEFGLTQEEVAKKVGRQRSTIANALRLLKLPKDIQEDILEGRLSAGHARALLSLEDKNLMRKLRNEIISKGLSVRQTETLAKKLREAKDIKQQKSFKDPNIVALEQELQELLGTKVKLLWSKGKTKLTIEFHSTEEFETFLDHLRKQRND